MSKLISIIILLAAGYGAYIFFGAHGPKEVEGSHGGHKGGAGMAMPVKTEAVTLGNVTKEVESVGTLKSNEYAAIKPEIAGRITQINFVEGSHVEKGEVLIKIDDSTIIAEKDQKQAAYDLAKLTFDRLDKLQKKGATSIQTKDDAYAAMKVAEADLNLVDAQLKKTIINAPFSGVIGFREVSEGDYLETGKTITNLENIDPIKVEFSIPEKYFADIDTGKKISIAVDAYDNPFTGEVYAIDPKIDPDTRNIRIKARVPNSMNLLRPGMFAYVSLTLGKKNKVLLIPEEAIIPSGKTSSVFRVSDGIAQLIPVVIGIRKDAKVEIIEGLEEGDVVVTAGHMKIRDGMPVTSMTFGKEK